MLIQTYISNVPIHGFTLISDMMYVNQNIGRICRAMFEVINHKICHQDELYTCRRFYANQLGKTEQNSQKAPAFPRSPTNTANTSTVRVDAPHKYSCIRSTEVRLSKALKALLEKSQGVQTFFFITTVWTKENSND